MLPVEEQQTTGHFSIFELMLSIVICAILSAMAIMSFVDRQQSVREATLKTNLLILRTALHRYTVDHGHHPCSPDDFNDEASAEVLAQQLTQFTDATGKPAVRSDKAFRFGPYLQQIPIEPISGLRQIWIDDVSRELLLGQTKANNDSSPGGWYYRTKSGTVHANLQADSKRSYLAFY